MDILAGDAATHIHPRTLHIFSMYIYTLGYCFVMQSLCFLRQVGRVVLTRSEFFA